MRLLVPLGLLICAACAHQPTAGPEFTLPGLWTAEYDVSPSAPEQVEVERVEGKWFVVAQDARVMLSEGPLGYQAALTAWKAEVRFAELDAASGVLHGHWIQPPSTIRNGRYASPIRAERAGDRWVAQVQPLADEVRVYVAIEEAGSGEFRAFMREPNSNLGRRFREMKVSRKGNHLSFLREDGNPAFKGTIKPDGTIFVSIPQLGGRLALTRAPTWSVPGFIASTSTTAPYEYHRPEKTDDGWSVASLSDVGMDAAPIVEMIDGITSELPSKWTSRDIHSVLIARRGKLVLDEYFHGHDRTRPHDSRSSGKSIGSTLLGIAASAQLVSLDQPLHKQIDAPPAEWISDPNKSKITLSHLASMSSGLACDDNDEASPGNEDRMQQESEDWYAHILGVKTLRPPGEAGVYCTAGINLVGAALAHATKLWIPAYFDKVYARPLQISNYHFNLAPRGRGYLGGGVRLRTRDFAKLGQLFLNGGTWEGARVLPESWVEAATAPHASVNEKDDYGYGWWRKTYVVQGKNIAAYYASGNGGQLLIVIPELELLVQFNAGNYGNYPTWRRFRDELIPKYLIPAAIGVAKGVPKTENSQ